jgi:hypothetical protein
MTSRERISEMLSFGLLLFVVNAWLIPWFQGKTLTGTEIAIYAGTSALGGVAYHYTTQWMKRRREGKNRKN